MSKVSAMSMIFIAPALLLLFTEIGFKRYSIIVLLMLIPGHFFITNAGSYQRHFGITVSIAVVMLILFISKNINTPLAMFTSFVRSFRPVSSPKEVFENSVFENIKNVVGDLKLISVKKSLPGLVLFILFIFSLIFLPKYATIAFIVFFLILPIFQSDSETVSWTNTFLYIGLLLSSLFFNFIYSDTIDLLWVALFFLLFTRSRQRIIVIFLMLFLSGYLIITSEENILLHRSTIQ